MKRFTDLEKEYTLQAIENEFRTSLNSFFNTKLEKKFSEKFGVKYAIGHVNGTQTLHTALNALRIQPAGRGNCSPANNVKYRNFRFTKRFNTHFCRR